MAGGELGGQLEDLDELVPPVPLALPGQGEQLEGETEPGGPHDPLGGLDRRLDPGGLVGGERGVRGSGPSRQLPEGETRAGPGIPQESGGGHSSMVSVLIPAASNRKNSSEPAVDGDPFSWAGSRAW